MPATSSKSAAKAKTLRISFLYRVFLDILILATLLALANNFSAFFPIGSEGDAKNVGYFVADPALSYPYIEDSVSPRMLYHIGQEAPLLIIFVMELIRFRSSINKQSILFSTSSVIAFLMQLYQPVSCFLFGYATERLFKVISKHCFPSLRPHFFDVCQPEPLDGRSMIRLVELSYVVNYGCAGREGVTESMLSGVSNAFPSGHASLSCYGMIFVVLYLQQRFVWRRTLLLKHVVQLACLLVAWYVSLSRIWDNMHQWWQVAIGAALGASIAVVAAFFIGGGCDSEKFKDAREKPVHGEAEGGDYELGSGGEQLKWWMGCRKDASKLETLENLDEIRLHTRL